MATTSIYYPSSKVTGSWFPSGYYGHVRSQPRNDIYTEFRKLARPQPPRAFITRIKADPVNHTFSHHDNRFSFITDATYLDLGVGKKRKIPGSASTKENKDLMTWQQSKPVVPQVSCYRFSYPDGKDPVQMMARRPKTSFETDTQLRRITSYRYAYGPTVYNPNKDLVENLSKDAVLARPRTSKPRPPPVLNGRLSVADCLVWKPYESAKSTIPVCSLPQERSSGTIGFVPDATPSSITSADCGAAEAAAE